MSLDQFLNEHGHHEFEGHLQDLPKQVDDILSYAKGFFPRKILEIGFNAGHSADAFLKEPYTKVTSFDIGYHHYVSLGKQYIDATYPDCHTLIMGNSVEVVPEFESSEKYDLIFIDGSTDYETMKADLVNCKRFAHDKTIVILDDTMTNSEWMLEWNVNPNRIWAEAVTGGLVTTIQQYDYTIGRGMSVGKYVF